VTKPTHALKFMKVSDIINTVFHVHICKIFLCLSVRAFFGFVNVSDDGKFQFVKSHI